MYDETNVPGPEYRVRTVVRHIVTRYCHPYTHKGDGQGPSIKVSGSSSFIGEFQNEQAAFDVANALAKAEPTGTKATVSA